MKNFMYHPSISLGCLLRVELEKSQARKLLCIQKINKKETIIIVVRTFLS